MKINPNNKQLFHAISSSLLSVFLLYILHFLPINQLFIDPFAEAIKNHDLMDIAFSRFRNHTDPGLYDERIIIINSGKTDRKKVASSIKYLSAQDVKSVGVDLVFDSLYHDASDTLLHNALVDNDRVVLGFSFQESKGRYISEMGLRTDTFFTTHSKQGFVNLASNDGFSVRAFEPFHNVEGREESAFSVKVLSLSDSTIHDELLHRHNKKEWINFKRVQPGVESERFPINRNKVTHYTQINIDKFLADTAEYKKGYLKDKIVLIGFCGEDDAAFSMKDRYFTPLNEQYSGRSLPDMHGVLVHANIISMLIDRDFINDVPDKMIYLISFMIFVVNYFIFSNLAQKRFFFLVPLVRVIQLVQFVLLFAFCIIFLIEFNIKFSFLTIITAVILSFELFEFYDHKLKNRIEQKVFPSDGSSITPDHHH